jgi:hypothetical protein
MDKVELVRAWEQPADTAERLCRAFYEQVYRSSFPRVDETEDPSIWLPLMVPDPPALKPRVFLIVVRQPGHDAPVAGGILFEQYRESGDWLATYIAVHPERRHAGMARRLIDGMVEAIADVSAGAAWHLFAEAEDPTRLPECEQAAGWDRLSTLSALGFRWVQMDYVQPALGPDKHPVHDLLLLCWQPPGTGAAPTPAQLNGFMQEFYRATDQSGAPGLAAMQAQLAGMQALSLLDLPHSADDMPARFDHVLGTADALTLRLTFISTPVAAASRQGIAEIALGELRPLDPSHRGAAAAQTLSDPFTSFHADIVVPFASASSMPVILQCEPFRDDPDAEPGSCRPRVVRIAFPPELRTRWEGGIRTTRYNVEAQGDWVVEARFLDSVAFYESGYIAYSAAFVFGKNGDGRTDINAAAILAVASLAGAAGEVVGTPVRMALQGEELVPPNDMLRRRLAALATQTATATVFSVIGAVGDRELRERLRNALLDMTFPDPATPDRAANTRATVSVEVIGSDHQQRILTAAQDAAQRTGAVDDFTLRLAGLVQNVLDFAEQDAIEVHDSLADAFRLGEEIAFAQRNMSIRFSPSSRAYGEAWCSLGGEPYWCLVELILCHNARLLADLHEEMRREQGNDGLSGLLHSLLIVPEALEGDPNDAKERLRRTHSRRIQLAYYIPNIFRYPTEQALYTLFEKARGLPIQRQYFLTLENTIERMEREFSLLHSAIAEDTRKQADDRRNNLLVAIGAAQTAGVFAAFASVAVAFAALDRNLLGNFLGELDTELGLSTVGQAFSGMPHVPPRDVDLNLWPLVLTLGLVCASASFLGTMAVMALVRRSRFWAVVAGLCVPAAIALAGFVVVRELGWPVVVVLIAICLVATVIPAITLQFWRSPQRAGGRRREA